MCILKKLTSLHKAIMMIKDYRLLIKLRHIRILQMLEKHVKQNW